jgi:HEPN domain-containing protein
MNRNDFQKLAILRLKEAEVLLKNKCYEGAYYLAGYSIECALKACIAKKTKRYEFPEQKKINNSYIHDLNKLIDVAELTQTLNDELKININFKNYWLFAKDWKETHRYENKIDKKYAEDIIKAIKDNNDGILKWLKKYW